MYDFHSLGIDTNGRMSGKIKTFCPKCRDTRRNKRDKSLSVHLDEGMGKCHYCGWTFNLAAEQEHERREAARKAARQSRGTVPQHFRRPVFDASRLRLSERLERWMVEQRCISQEAVAYLRLTEQPERMPQTGKVENCLCFNYFENGVLVNTKFRDGAKNFKMVTGAELIPYNVDGILDTPEAIVTEGEFDAASFVTIGRRDVVSVPSGANRNLTWLDRFVESHFDGKRTIFVAVDTDRKGDELRDELIRRLGAERCRVVTYGSGCKDANDHLRKYGAESLRIALEQAKEVPLEGVFTAGDLSAELRALYENGFGPGAETGWENFDACCTLELSRLMVVTGVPGSGKSEWVDELVLRLCLRHNWDIGFFSPENIPIVYHLRKLAEKLTGARFRPGPGMSEGIYLRVCRYLSAHVCHILPKDDFTVEAVLSKGRELVARRGIRILVIDPLNRLEHAIPPGQTETQYLSGMLNRLSAFAVRNRCLVILVAHPRKMNRNAVTGRTPRPEMYDINGSADFYNKADFGIVIERDDAVRVVRVHIDKVKFKQLGQPGLATAVYNPVNGRFAPCREDDDPQVPADRRVQDTRFDSACWLPEEELFEEGGE